MRQGITTRYLGPTNIKGSRIKAVARRADAWGPEQNITAPLDYALSTEQNHTRVAHLLAVKLGWTGLWVGGGNAPGNGFCYVNIGEGQYRAIDDYRASFADGEGSNWFYVMNDDEKAMAALIAD